ncbi:MAG: M14 family zinc carboxypeptidase [Patescibacteria group bacterium]
MRDFFVRRAIGTIILIALIASGFFVFNFFQNKKEVRLAIELAEEISKTLPKQEVIGYSIEKRKIEAYIFGHGEKQILFVGGIHGGYEWNSVLLAYKFIDYLKTHPEFIPENITISIIPSANPDGVYKITNKEGIFSKEDIKESEIIGLGRFNNHDVDLNRNFDCKWKPESTWRSKVVSAGSSPFSEPESQAIKNFVLEKNPLAVVFWHSQSNAVYASECENGILPETLKIMNTYAKASGYPAVDSFDSYEITGDAEGWLASINIPAITVELKTHETIEWDKNLSGVKALLNYYQQ